MEDIKFLDVKGRHNMILQLSDGYFVDLCKHHNGEPSARLRHEVIRNIYIYFSYILHRALTFVKLVKGIPSKKDRNDYEDSQIYMHLALDTPYSIVTDDNRMKTALKETICLLREHAMAEFQTTLNVCGFSDYQIT